MKCVVSILSLLLLAGCMQLPYGPDGEFQNVELDNRLITIPRDQVELYGCPNREPLSCRCHGRVGVCDCSCPLRL